MHGHAYCHACLHVYSHRHEYTYCHAYLYVYRHMHEYTYCHACLYVYRHMHEYAYCHTCLNVHSHVHEGRMGACAASTHGAKLILTMGPVDRMRCRHVLVVLAACERRPKATQ